MSCEDCIQKEYTKSYGVRIYWEPMWMEDRDGKPWKGTKEEAEKWAEEKRKDFGRTGIKYKVMECYE